MSQKAETFRIASKVMIIITSGNMQNAICLQQRFAIALLVVMLMSVSLVALL
jgi:hypothetical protein